VSEGYKRSILEYQKKIYGLRIGYVPGFIRHYFHGSKENRKYSERWKILVDNHFDPYLDLKKDWQGLYQLTDRSTKLRDDIRAYFKNRNEDSIELNPDDIKIN
jgi:hypothetical protein